MTTEERSLAGAMIALCVKAKNDGVTLLLANFQNDTNIYCCSSTEPEVIRHIIKPELTKE